MKQIYIKQNNPSPKFILTRKDKIFTANRYTLEVVVHNIDSLEDETHTIFKNKKFDNRRHLLSTVSCEIRYALCVSKTTEYKINDIWIEDHSQSRIVHIDFEESVIEGFKRYQYFDLLGMLETDDIDYKSKLILRID